MVRANQKIVRKAATRNLRQPSLHVTTQNPAIVGFVVQIMTDADKSLTVFADQFVECAAEFGSGEVYPADNAGNPLMLFGNFEKPPRFVKRCDGLHEHRSVDLVLLEE